MNIRYDSYADFLADAKRSSASMNATYSGNDWAGGTFKSALEYGCNGDDALVTEAQTLLDQLSSVDYGERTREFSPSVCGAYPIVPEYLAGHPLCMREPRETENLAPVAIYCCTTISAGLSEDQIMKRGIAILALVLKLQTIRSVDLYVTFEGHGATDGDLNLIIPIESKPLSLAHACYALTGTSFARRLTYAVAQLRDNFNGLWGNHSPYGKGNYNAWITEQLQLTENDMYIKPGHYDDELINAPVDWINKQLKRYSGTKEATSNES